MKFLYINSNYIMSPFNKNKIILKVILIIIFFSKSLWAQKDLIVHYNSISPKYSYNIKIKGNTALISLFVKEENIQKGNSIVRHLGQNWRIFHDFAKGESIKQELLLDGEVILLYKYYSKPAKWIFMEGEKEILGYKCKRALLDSSEFGRASPNAQYGIYTVNLEVWFTEDIPLNISTLGDFHFPGLPGIILEANRTSKSKNADSSPSTTRSGAVKIEKQNLPDLYPTEGVWVSPEELEKVKGYSEKKLRAWYKEKQK